METKAITFHYNAPKELWWNPEKGELNDFLKDVQFVSCAACGSARHKEVSDRLVIFYREKRKR